jgi:hypothetical protein
MVLAGAYSAATGIYFILAAIVVGGLSYIAFNLFADVARDQGTELPHLALWCVTNRAWLPLLTLPTLILGILIIRAVGGKRFAMVVLALLFLLVPLVLVLYCFVATVAPMYQMQPL